MASTILCLCTALLLCFGVTANFAVKRDHVCYQPFGCFHSDGTEVRVPQNPLTINTHFKLYNRQHRHSPYRDLGGNNWASQVPEFASHFDGSKKTKILIHGFLDRGTTTWISQVRDALLIKGDFNVLIVDWGTGSKWPYEQATGNSFLVGAELALLLEYLFGHSHLQYQDVHIIAHSLGAQVAGHAGGILTGKIGRISALDPADPGFTGKPLDRRLDASDAVFVDVIHSDGSHFNFVSGYGTTAAVGDIDFYPNGGEHQPGCSEKPAGSALSGLLSGALGSVLGSLTCSHSRAHEYFLESISSSCKFIANPCNSLADFDAGKCTQCPPGGCPIMGYDADKAQVHGKFYLATSMTPKYCGKEYIIEIHVADALQTTYGELFVTLLGTKRKSEELKFTRVMRQYHKGDVEKRILASHTDIGTVQGIMVKFVRGTDLHALGAAHEIVLKSVIIGDAESNTRIQLCGHNAHIQENSITTLHDQSGC